MSPNVCVRKIIVGTEVVDGHLDTCATHCFVSTSRSKLLSKQGYLPIKIKPFPIGQGEPLPDATQAHLAPLWFISQEGQLTGFGTVLYLVSNTGADILIANNILDFLGILRYRPPIGYEESLITEARKLFIPREKRIDPWFINPETLDHMIHKGQCLITETGSRTSVDGKFLLPIAVDQLKDGQWNKSVDGFVPDLQEQCSELSVNICRRCGKHRERCTCNAKHVHFKLDSNDVEPPAATVPEPEGPDPDPQPHPYPLTPNGPVAGLSKGFERHCQVASKQKELGKEDKSSIKPSERKAPVQKQEDRRELRQKKIQEAIDLKVGKEPPLKQEIMDALDLLKRIAETSAEQICSKEEIEELQQQLKKGRPQWAQCLTAAHIQATQEVQWAKDQIEELMDGRFKETVFGKTLATPCSFQPFPIKVKEGTTPERAVQPRRFKDPSITKLIDDWVEGLLKDSLIEESQTPVAAPVTVVLKKGREPRVCIDYRERNARTDTPIYPMPDVHDFLDGAAGFNYYCSFDCSKMFNQFEIVKEHRYLAAFMTQRGTYEPTRIMFGVTGGPQHAVRSARPALKTHPKTNGTLFTKWAIAQNEKGENPPYEIDPRSGIVPGSCLDIFIDDCRIPQNKLPGIVELCRLFFEWCEEFHLVLSRKKAKLCLTHLPFLGFVVSAQGKHLDPTRISSLLEVPTPTSREGLHALLCSFNFVRMFITDFSIIAAPLYAATKGIIWKGPGSGRSKGTREVDPAFVWTDVLDRALRQLQGALLGAPILSCPDYTQPIFLSVDACLKGEGWVLWQIVTGKNGSKIPVAIHYGSTKYDESESTWEVTRQEAHAIQSALKDVYDYIFSCHFYLLTDHRNLTFLSNSINRAVIRIRHFMQQFNMTVVHVPGAWNNPADGISRLDPEALSANANLDLITATTVHTSNEFATTHRGTQPGDPDFTEGDRIVEISVNQASAFFTLGSRPQIGCQWDHCLLCQPNLQEETQEPEGRCFFSQGLEAPELIEDSDSECSEESFPDWENEWDLVEHVQLQCQESKILLTRAQARKEAEEWNRKCQAEARLVPPAQSEESDWLPNMADARACKTLTVSREWETQEPLRRPMSTRAQAEVSRQLAELVEEGLIQPNYTCSEGPSQRPRSRSPIDSSPVENPGAVSKQDEELKEKGCKPPPKFTHRDEPTLHAPHPTTNEARVAKEICDQETQTTPADFRATQIRSPLEADFKSIHNDEEGHHGIDHSYRKLMVHCGSKWAEERETATKVRNDLKTFIKNCPTCQKVRGLQDKVKSKHSFISSRPFTEVSYDFVVFEKPDRNGNRYLIVAVDNFTKLVEMKAVPDRGAEGVAQFLLELKSRYGPINRLRSDREKAFTSSVISKLNELTGTSTLPCVAYHPQANSICERQNQIIMNHLRALVYGAKLGTDSMFAWSDLIPFVYSIVNTTPKLPLAISPLSLVYGIFANYDRPLLDPRPTGVLSNPVDYVEGLKEWQNRLLELAEGIQSKYFEKLTSKKHECRAFQEGDFVLQLKKTTGARGKLITRWIGPRLVLSRRDNDATHPVLDLYDLVTSKKLEASIDDCRLFHTGWFTEPTMLQDLNRLAALDKEEYEVELILEHKPTGPRRNPRTKPSDYWFKVKWAGFSDEENSWEPYSELKDLLPLEEYLSKYPELNFLNTH